MSEKTFKPKPGSRFLINDMPVNEQVYYLLLNRVEEVMKDRPDAYVLDQNNRPVTFRIIEPPDEPPPPKPKAQAMIVGTWAELWMQGVLVYGVLLVVHDWKKRLQQWADEHDVEIEW